MSNPTTRRIHFMANDDSNASDTKGSGPSAETQRINDDAEELHERASALAKAQLGEDAPPQELNKRIEDILLTYGARVPELSEAQLQAQADANRQIDSEGRPVEDDDHDGVLGTPEDEGERPSTAAAPADRLAQPEGGVLTQARQAATTDRTTGPTGDQSNR